MTVIRAYAHGKVNLHLACGDVRDDGYHELVTVFQSLSLRDIVELHALEDVTPTNSVVSSLRVTGPGSRYVPENDTNLAWKAVDVLVDALRHRDGDDAASDLPAFELRIQKGIPVAGGMAGGSADAAAALLVMNTYLADRGFSRAELLDLAAKLGSDVPFTLAGGTMIGTGRGEQLTPMLSRGTYHWALAFHSKGLSTPRVFSKLDELRASNAANETGTSVPRAGSTEALAAALMTGSAEELAPLLVNDLQAAALSLRPDLRKTLNAGVEAGALAGIVSGSGPTCAFLCKTAEAATDVASSLIDAGVAAYSTTASGPAPGAELI